MDVELVQGIRDQVVEALGVRRRAQREAGAPALTREAERELARDAACRAVGAHVQAELAKGRDGLSRDEEAALIAAVLAALFGLGRIEPLLADPQVENIDINGADVVWVSYADGRRERVGPVADSDAELIELVRHLAAYEGLSGRMFDRANPLLALRLPDGSRLHAIMGVSPRPALSIRRHRLLDVSLAEMVELGSIDRELYEFLTAAVRARCNLMLTGATDSGKTTLLRALAGELDPAERLITVERTLELQFHEMPTQHADVVALEGRPPNLEGAGGVRLAELVRHSLGMNPSRVIVGEVVGPEIVVMLQAMTQGNDGSMSTIHARSTRHVLDRIHAYAAEAEEKLPSDVLDRLVAGGLDFLVFLESRTVGGRKRRVISSVREVTGRDAGQVLTSEVFTAAGDRPAVRNAVAIERIERLIEAGYRPPRALGRPA